MSEDFLPNTSSEDKPSVFSTYKIPIILCLIALFLIFIGLRLIVFPIQKSPIVFSEEPTGSVINQKEIKVDISGAITNPGVYDLKEGSRIQDLLVLAGGLSVTADRDWVAKYLNLAGKLVDSTKIYIPSIEENVTVAKSVNISNSITNINNASNTELDKLPGIGEVTAQKIISGRPYGSIDELISKKIISQSVFEKLKDKIGVY
jgi:competence protein ComEA